MNDEKPWRRAAPALRSGASPLDPAADPAPAKVLPSDPAPIPAPASEPVKPARRGAASAVPATPAEE